jgi:hypothetical protein
MIEHHVSQMSITVELLEERMKTRHASGSVGTP